jgi:hypothetical protein
VWLVAELVYEIRPACDGRIGRSAVDEAWGSSGGGRGGRGEVREGWLEWIWAMGELERVGVGVGVGPVFVSSGPGTGWG